MQIILSLAEAGFIYLRMTGHARTHLLKLLKSDGPQTAHGLSQKLSVTAVAIRHRLDTLHADNLVQYEDVRGSVGRPKRLWSLSSRGHQLFPDNHANLALSLLAGMTDILGPEASGQIIAYREQHSRALYQEALKAHKDLPGRLEKLADLRTQEGYMAGVEADGPGFRLIENHCSICAAARAFPAFCQSELNLFRSVLGPEVRIERQEHLLSGGRRCVYKIETPQSVEP